MISTQTLENLRQFFGTQFHQDWVDEADDRDVVVEEYIVGSRHSRQELKDMGQGILDYMQGIDDAELERRLHDDLYSYSVPHEDDLDGLSAREWLHKVAAMLMENDKQSS